MISTKKQTFVVEFRPTAIRAIRASAERAPVVIEEVLEIDLLKESDVAGKLRAFASAKGNAYLHANCCVYPQHRLLRHLVLDAARGKETDFVLKHLRTNAGIDPDAYSVFCLSAADGTDADLAAFNKKAVLLCGAPRSEIVDIQKILVENGVYPSRVEIGTIGMIGFLKDTIGQGEEAAPLLFLEIDTDSTNAVIVGPKGVEMARRIDCGATHIATSLKEEMSLKDDAAAEKILRSRDFDLGPIAPKILRKLLRELQSSIGFFEVQTGQSVARLFCLKQGGSLSWLEQSVADLLNLKPLQLEMKEWLAARNVTFGSDAIGAKTDATWAGLLAMVLNFEKERAA